MYIKAKWLPCILVVLELLFVIALVVCETNKVTVLNSGELLLRFGKTNVGTFEATTNNTDPNLSYRLRIEKGADGSSYDLESNNYQTFGFNYGSGDYKVTLYRKNNETNKGNNDYVQVSAVTINAEVDGANLYTGTAMAATEIVPPTVDTSIHYDAVWEMRKYTHTNGKKISYWINVPEGATSGMPIVIFLHGDSEMGKPKAVSKLRQVKYMRQSKEYIAIAPVGTNRDWTSDNVQEALKGLIDECISKYQIDTSRVYIWGFSRGSIGTWGMVERYGSFFTAAVPISCGSYNGSSVKTENFVDTKIYALAGSKESRYIKQMKSIVNMIVKAGGSAKFETVPGQSHDTMSKNFPYAEVIDNWLLKQ